MGASAPVGLRYPWETPPDHTSSIEVAPGVLWLRLPLPMKLDHVNAYALDEGDSWTIIDTGFASKRGRAIWGKLLEGPLAGKPVSRVIVTHHHPDHVGLAGWFIEHGATLCIPRTGWLMARMLTLDVQETPNAETIKFYTRAGMDASVLEQRKSERPFNFADCVVPLPLGYSRLIEGDTIKMGGRTWDIRMGNGHAPEHATFWSRDDNIVIGGDQLLSSISPNLGVYATEPDADPVTDWLQSCKTFQAFAEPNQIVLGGHKLPFTGLPTRLTQLIENHHGALKRLLAHLKEPHSAGECFMPLFKRNIGPGEYGLALVEAVAHLNLRDDGAWVFQAL